MGRASQATQRAKRDLDLPERIRELAEIDAQNLPRKQGDVLGYFQYTDLVSGQTRRWTVKIGQRQDQITFQTAHSIITQSMGWTQFFSKLRKHLTK